MVDAMANSRNKTTGNPVAMELNRVVRMLLGIHDTHGRGLWSRRRTKNQDKPVIKGTAAMEYRYRVARPWNLDPFHRCGGPSPSSRLNRIMPRVRLHPSVGEQLPGEGPVSQVVVLGRFSVAHGLESDFIFPQRPDREWSDPSPWLAAG